MLLFNHSFLPRLSSLYLFSPVIFSPPVTFLQRFHYLLSCIFLMSVFPSFPFNNFSYLASGSTLLCPNRLSNLFVVLSLCSAASFVCPLPALSLLVTVSLKITSLLLHLRRLVSLISVLSHRPRACTGVSLPLFFILSTEQAQSPSLIASVSCYLFLALCFVGYMFSQVLSRSVPCSTARIS